MDSFLYRIILTLILMIYPAACLRCFVCNSGNSVAPNFGCPAEGWVDASKVPMKDCPGMCYIKTAVWNTGAVVHRGCAPQHVLPRKLPTGCNIYGGDIWCMCGQDGCNGRRLGETFQDQ